MVAQTASDLSPAFVSEIVGRTGQAMSDTMSLVNAMPSAIPIRAQSTIHGARGQALIRQLLNQLTVDPHAVRV